MNESKHTPLTSQIQALLPDHWLGEQAESLSVVQRQRLVHIQDFVWTLIFAFGSGQETTLNALRSAFNLQTGLSVARSSFNKRFNPELASLMSACVHRLIGEATSKLPHFDSHWLERFSNFAAIDATVIRVHHSLRHLWPSTHTDQAAIKLHTVYNVTHGFLHKIKLSAATVHDSKPWKRLGSWVRGQLLVFDLGYYDFNLFARLHQKGALFVTRAKCDFNPVIVEVYRNSPGRAMKLEGKKLQDVLPKLRRKVLDAKVQVSYKTQKYKGKQRSKTLTLRLVMLRNEESGKYHSYLCNLDERKQSAEEIAALYKRRWEIELLFKSLKSGSGGLVSIPGKRACVVKCLVWACVAKMLISRMILRSVRKEGGGLGKRIRVARWDKRISEAADRILSGLVVLRAKDSSTPLMDFLLREAKDPNLNRPNLLDLLAFS